MSRIDPALVPVLEAVETLEAVTGTPRGRRVVTLDYAEGLIHAALEEIDRPRPAPVTHGGVLDHLAVRGAVGAVGRAVDLARWDREHGGA